MNISLLLVIGGIIVFLLALTTFLIGLRILPGGITWHKRLAWVTIIFGALHGLGGILNFLGLLPF